MVNPRVKALFFGDVFSICPKDSYRNLPYRLGAISPAADDVRWPFFYSELREIVKIDIEDFPSSTETATYYSYYSIEEV